jgi:Pup-like protein
LNELSLRTARTGSQELESLVTNAGRARRERCMGEENGDQNGRSPHERREDVRRRDEELKREVDEALEQWDRLLEADASAETVSPAHR